LWRASDAYLTEDRIPAHEDGAGEWTDGAGSQGGASSEVNPNTIDEVANRDYHDLVVAKIARIARRLGCKVVTEIPLVGVDGTAARVDLLILAPDGRLTIIEVKTGLRPKFEDVQRIIYPMAQIGEHVFSPDPRIVELGFEPMERLPAMQFDTLYKKDRKSRLQLVEPHNPFDF